MNGKSPARGRLGVLALSFVLVLALPAIAAAAPSPQPSPPASPGAREITGGPTATPPPAHPERSAAEGGAESKGTATETPPDDAAVPSIEGIVVTGRRLRTQADADRTASATVVSAERFAGEAKGVAELVATAPGVAVNDYGGLGRLATASIRGSTADGVLVLLDGLPLNGAFGGGVDLSSIPRSWIDRIEVVRGVEGAHYGAGALGGVVNVVTRHATEGAWSAEAVGGSFGTFGASADRSLRLGDASLLLSAGADATDGAFPYQWTRTEALADAPLRDSTRAHNGSARGGALAKLSVPLGRVKLDVVSEVSAGRRELPPQKGFDADGSRDWQEDARALVAVRAAVAGPLPGLSLAGKTALRLDTLDTRLAALGPLVRRQRGGSASGGAEALLDHGAGLLRVEATAGSEWLDDVDPGGGRSRARLAAAASEDLLLASGRVRIAPALRYDRIGDHDGASGKLGVSVALVGPLSVRASAGRTFRPPSFAELYLQQGLAQPNPDLRSEKGTGADASVVVDVPAGFASVGAHATRYHDLVVWETASFNRLKPFNTGESVLAGVEAEAASAPIRSLAGLSLAAAYTWLFSENLRGSDVVAGKDLPRRPRHRLYARTGIAPGRFAAHVEAQWVGRQWEDVRNLSPIPAVLLWNAGGSVALDRARTLALNLEVRNLLDDRTFLDPLGSPMPGRMVLLSIRAGSSRQEVTP